MSPSSPPTPGTLPRLEDGTNEVWGRVTHVTPRFASRGQRTFLQVKIKYYALKRLVVTPELKVSKIRRIKRKSTLFGLSIFCFI